MIIINFEWNVRMNQSFSFEPPSVFKHTHIRMVCVCMGAGLCGSVLLEQELISFR